MKRKYKKIDEDEFLKSRKEVLSLWPTGKEVNLEEAVEYQRGLPDYKRFVKVVEKLHKEGKTVVFPRAGTPILEDEIELTRTLVESGLPIIPVTPDSYCRLGAYDKAQKGLEESIKANKPELNGYPTVIHGVRNTRKVVESTEAALNQRLTNVGGSRLMAEIAFASGMTAALVDPFQTFACYEKKTTLEDCIEYYLYVERLMGYYADRGVIITQDIDGMLPHGTFPTSVGIACVIVVALIAAEQGVRSIIPWSKSMGHMAQDIAWANTTRKLIREYLDNLGYGDVKVPGIFIAQLPIFPYPQSLELSLALLNYSATIAALAQAEAAYLRTPDEAAGIPTKEAHALSYRSANCIFSIVRAQKIELDYEDVKIEEKITEMEVRAILDKLMELGDGDVADGSIKAVESGIIDYPLSPNINVKDNVMGVRDSKGACRYVEFGNLPIPDEAKEFHREKIAERENSEGRKMDYRVMIEDFWAFSKGNLLGRPS